MASPITLASSTGAVSRWILPAADVEQVVHQARHLHELARDHVAAHAQALGGQRFQLHDRHGVGIGASGLRSSWPSIARNS
jgi:hypothetical protein